MAVIESLLAAIVVRLRVFAGGLVALGAIIGRVVPALIGTPRAQWKRALAGLVAEPTFQRRALALLRAFQPNLVLTSKLVSAYPNTGTAIVTRATDVIEVLDREADFEVVYAPKMNMITAGSNFFLGMQDTPQYTHDVSLMRLAIRREDVATRLVPTASARAETIVATSAGRIDVPASLTLPIPYEMVATYFGLPGPGAEDMIDWTTIMFWYLFIDLTGDPDIAAKATAAASRCRDSLDQAIAARKAAPNGVDDVVGRCLALQSSGVPGFDDIAIRNNLIGMVIGAIPTLNKAAVQALDQLIDRPDDLRRAQDAARAGDVATVAASLFEALRFNPINPVIYRRATRDCRLAPSTLRSRVIPQGTMVLASNLSAMFDPMKLRSPNEFRLDRPAGDYILWGYGLHTCFGAHINHAIIPAMLMPLLRQRTLRRATGPAGQIDFAGTPFPKHWVLEFS